MLPDLAVPDSLNHPLRYPEVGSDFGTASRVQSNGSDFVWVEFGVFSGCSEAHAAIPCGVGHVVGLGTYKEMRGITARRIIASVADVFSRLQGAMCQFPRDTMGVFCSFRPWFAWGQIVNAPVTELGANHLPFPAFMFCSHVYAGPESSGEIG